MNFLQRWILGKDLVARIEEKAALYKPGIRYLIQQGKIVAPADNKLTYIQEGYNKNDIIYAVVNIVLDKVRLPEWSLYKVVEESSLKKYQRIMSRKTITGKEYKEAMKYKAAGLEPIEKFNLQMGKLNDLLTYPNECETFQDFVTFGSLYKMLTGDVYMWAEMLNGGANKGIPNEIWILPSQYMTIRATDEFPAKAASYELTMFNQQFTKESILHEMYANPNWSTSGEQLYGFAPLRSFLKNINRNNWAKDSSAAQFQNGGLADIIYFDDARFDPVQGKAQVEAVKIKLAEEYSGPSNAGKHAVSGYKVGVAPVGNTPIELGIIESEKWDAIMFCNAYGVPPELLGLTAKTYNNMKEAEKALTTRGAIPLLTSRRNSLNRKIQSDWGFKDVNVYIDYETECFTELQTDMNEVVNSTSKMMMITPNEERELANMDARPEKEADEPWVIQNGGRVPLSDFQANDVDEALNNNLLNEGNTATNTQAGNNGQGNGEAGKKRVSYAKKVLS
jgi:HK97 family phage portal protein